MQSFTTNFNIEKLPLFTLLINNYNEMYKTPLKSSNKIISNQESP